MARIRPASTYQRPDSLTRAAARAAKPRIRRTMRAALQTLGQSVDVQMAERLGRSGRWRDIARDAVRWPQFRETLRGVFGEIAAAYNDGAEIGVRRINGAFRRRGRPVRYVQGGGWRPTEVRGVVGGWTPARKSLDELFDVSKAFGDRFNFDTYNDDTITWLRSEQDRLIQEMEQQARDTIETAILNGIENGRTPAEISSDIRQVISLTSNQAQAVANYRTLLEEGDPAALQRVLRNPEYDDVVRQAIADGADLEATVIDTLTEEYNQRYLDYRANTIAGTEANRATNDGLHDSYRQAIERGAMPAEAVRRYWKVALEENVCPVCLSIPDLNPDGVAVDEAFDSIAGPFMDPPEPHPNCQCSVEYQVDLDMVPQEPEPADQEETVIDL